MEPAPPSLLCRASLCFVMGQRELDAVTRRFAARHVLTDGHTAAVLRARRIAGDLTGHDDLLHGKRVVISEVMSTIKNFPECRQFCCVIDSLPSKPLLMGRCHTQRNDQRKKAKGECCRAHLTYLLDEIRQHSATAAKVSSSGAFCHQIIEENGLAQSSRIRTSQCSPRCLFHPCPSRKLKDPM
jgi:hypothetical protein